MDTFKIKEAIEEEQYTIWPHNTEYGIGKLVATINPITHRVDLTTYYQENAVGGTKTEKVLSPEEKTALQNQINRLTSICKDRYEKK